MRTLLILNALTGAIFGSMPATAQTPDGETPAVETVCDVLIGATPGLYGLCVAYCEAHDADILSPDGDPAELDVPNREILENYNRRKTASDPPMPCVQQETCPCWTADQVSTVLPPAMNFDVNFPHACLNSATTAALENFENGTGVEPGIQLLASNVEGERFCDVNNFNYPGGPPDASLAITAEEFESCKSILAAHANDSKTDGIVWDCFTQ